MMAFALRFGSPLFIQGCCAVRRRTLDGQEGLHDMAPKLWAVHAINANKLEAHTHKLF